MPFNRFVETGRVALIADGENKGKLVSIVDIIDQTRVLVDGPCTNVSRIPIRLNQLHLTKLSVKHPFTAPTRVVRKAWGDAKILDKWNASIWATKLANKEKRQAMSDYDRFKLRKAKSRRNRIRTVVFHNLRSAGKRSGALFGKKTKGGDKPKPKKGSAKAAPAKKADPKKGKK